MNYESKEAFKEMYLSHHSAYSSTLSVTFHFRGQGSHQETHQPSTLWRLGGRGQYSSRRPGRWSVKLMGWSLELTAYLPLLFLTSRKVSSTPIPISHLDFGSVRAVWLRKFKVRKKLCLRINCLRLAVRVEGVWPGTPPKTTLRSLRSTPGAKLLKK